MNVTTIELRKVPVDPSEPRIRSTYDTYINGDLHTFDIAVEKGAITGHNMAIVTWTVKIGIRDDELVSRSAIQIDKTKSPEYVLGFAKKYVALLVEDVAPDYVDIEFTDDRGNVEL